MEELFNIKMYSTQEVAELLKVTERSVYNYIKAGKIKAKKIGGKWRVTEENFKYFLTDSQI